MSVPLYQLIETLAPEWGSLPSAGPSNAQCIECVSSVLNMFDQGKRMSDVNRLPSSGRTDALNLQGSSMPNSKLETA